MEKIYKLELDVDQMCRTCLDKNILLENLFCSEIVDGDIVPIPDVYESVLGSQVGEIVSYSSRNDHYNS